MAEIILYITNSDAESIVRWINDEDDVAWIVKESQKGCRYRWKAVYQINEVDEGEYCLWKVDAGSLRIPTGSIYTADAVVEDPFSGWEQTLENDTAEVPWFGAAAPETFGFTFREIGKEAENSLGRSGFHWIGNYFRVIGNGAPEESEKWWSRLKRYIKKSSTGIPWTKELGPGRTGAYAFPEAYEQLKAGRGKDINP